MRREKAGKRGGFADETMAKAVIFTLGCKVNEVESASLARALGEQGYEVSTKLGYADLYILNTCAVTAEAEKKSRQLVARALKYNPNARVLVCGCAAQKNAQVFAARQNVRAVTGARNKSRIPSLLEAAGIFVDDADKAFDELPLPAAVRTRHFIKIQDGCNNFCSYCIVPYMRGRSRSRATDSVVAEAYAAAERGAEEIVLTGIDISSYRDGEKGLAELLGALSSLPARVRLGSLEVRVVNEKLLTAARGMSDFAPHFHLSLQSGSSAVLRRMNRHYTREEYLERCRMIYEFFPRAAITTDIIAGFPGETEEEFSDTLSIIDEAAFAQVHCFVYSPREGTPAAALPQFSPEVKEDRRRRLAERAAARQAAYVDGFLGQTFSFVPEEQKDGFTFGYTENYIRVAVHGNVPKRGRIILKERKEEYCIGEIDHE